MASQGTGTFQLFLGDSEAHQSLSTKTPNSRLYLSCLPGHSRCPIFQAAAMCLTDSYNQLELQVGAHWCLALSTLLNIGGTIPTPQPEC